MDGLQIPIEALRDADPMVNDVVLSTLKVFFLKNRRESKLCPKTLLEKAVACKDRHRSQSILSLFTLHVRTIFSQRAIRSYDIYIDRILILPNICCAKFFFFFQLKQIEELESTIHKKFRSISERLRNLGTLFPASPLLILLACVTSLLLLSLFTIGGVVGVAQQKTRPSYPNTNANKS